MTRVLIADDHPLMRQGLRAVFSGAPDIEVVVEAENGREAVEQSVRRRPDVVLMDLDMPVLHGIEATREIVAQCPGTAILVLTMFDDDESVFAAIKAGATGYLLKGSEGDEILTAVRAAAAGQPVFGAAFAERLQRWLINSSDAAPSPFPELTPRELQVLDSLASGYSNYEIGERLQLSPKTIANNVSTILNKLEVSQRSEAIVRAREGGLGQRAQADDEAGADSGPITRN